LLWSGFDFGNSLFSCPTPLSGASLMGEESCYWLRPSGRVANLSSHDGYFGFRESAAGLTGGVQGEIAPHWYLDMGAGYERSDIDTDTSSARGHVFHGGAALKYIRDRWLFAGSLSGAFARYDTNRFGIPTAGTATADADTASLDARLRVAYTFGTPSFYMKPMVDFDLVGLWRGAIDETGADALNLHIEDETDWIASAAPAVEFGRQWRHGDTLWRPYVRLGVRFLSEGSVAATASFAGAPAGVPAFTVTSPLDRTLAEVSAGFDVWQSERFSLRVSYDGRFGANTSDNGGALKLRARF
jgi:outer membrane autotransporter protein